MNTDKNLILIKGEDKTESIRSWNYQNGRIMVTFSNGKAYPYATPSVEFFKDPIVVFPNDVILLYNSSPVENMKSAQIFEKHIRVYFKSGYKQLFERGHIEIVRSSLADGKSKSCFEYLKQIAHAVGLRDEQGKSILGNRYEKIDFVREDSILASFLSERMPKASVKSVATPVYPFGFNTSQKTAVDYAISNPLSVIEGPPGTGKTQTILNIIANAVMNGESVAVVSSNNSATANVQEKLKKNGVGFISAYLGNSQNKTDFIGEQTTLPDLSSWIITEQEKEKLRQNMQTLFTELGGMLQNKNKLSEMRLELDGIELEHKHFEQYCGETYSSVPLLKSFRKINSQKALALWIMYENYSERKTVVSRLERIKNFFRFGLSGKAFEGLSFEQIIIICQKHYYSQKLIELNKETERLTDLLSRYSFDDKMKEYSEISMKLFRAKLYEKYRTHARAQYIIDDLWKNSEDFINDYPVILSTTYSLRSSLSNNTVYDYVIVDEASQVDLATGALALSCAKKAVIVGDLKQLPNVVDTKQTEISNKIFEQYKLNESYRYAAHSLLLSISELFPDVPKTLLREHYRCHPKIIDFCNKKFYNDQLIILTEPNSDRKPLMVYKTAPGNHERERVNRRQIEVIKDEIIPQQNINSEVDSVGIVTPYRNQTNALQQAFKDTRIKADTVDKFQGQENDIIILSIVDNEISEFADNANRLNVAVSRAAHQLIVVVNGNEEKSDTNMSDLLGYIQYNNLEVIESEIYSVFDYLFRAYTEKRQTLLKGKKLISEYDSENLMYNLISDILKQDRFGKYDIATHVPLRMILRTPDKLDDAEVSYAMNPWTHVDFLIFNKLGKSPVIIVEVDGAAFHAADSEQANRDKMKDGILEKYNLPILRLRTDESREKERLEERLLGL